jgi:NTP pyrophosphatase (non-canonical NTP hydrolase)
MGLTYVRIGHYPRLMSNEPTEVIDYAAKDFGAYQSAVATTAIYPGAGTGSALALAYVGLGLGEAGEIQGKIKKVIRDDEGVLTEAARIAIAKELGDLLWYVARTATEISMPLDIIAQINLNKLSDRLERGALQGSGDDR